MHRITQQRKSILEIINRLGHATLPEIQDNLVYKGENIALSTIYRSLETLEKENVIRRIPSKYGQDLNMVKTFMNFMNKQNTITLFV